jgi:hypothetical protein
MRELPKNKKPKAKPKIYFRNSGLSMLNNQIPITSTNSSLQKSLASQKPQPLKNAKILYKNLKSNPQKNLKLPNSKLTCLSAKSTNIPLQQKYNIFLFQTI